MAAATIDEYLAGLPAAVAPVASALRAVIDGEAPDAASRMYQGIPVWFFRDAMSIGVKANSRDVSLLFFAGQRMSDPTGLLRASGSFELASVKLATTGDVDEDVIRDWIRRAREVEG